MTCASLIKSARGFFFIHDRNHTRTLRNHGAPGIGGNGEVYPTTDAKLGRSVAIKFLPETFSHNTELVARFQQEARVLASLNHPSIIAAIYICGDLRP